MGTPKFEEKIHKYENRGESTTLVRTLPAISFIKGGETIRVQNGNFFLDMEYLDPDDVPNWAIEQLETLKPEALESVGFQNYFEAGDEEPEDEEPEDEEPPQQTEALQKALNELDPEVKSHWTKRGQPSLKYLSKVVDFKVTRRMVNAIEPDLVREEA